MARNNTARAESIVTLNGKAAESALDALKSKAKQYRQEIEAASKAGDTTKIKKLTAELKATENAMRNVRQQTTDYNAVLKNLNGSSITQLEKAAKAFKNELKGLSPATQEYINKSKQLDLVRARLDALNGRARENSNWMSRAGNTFNKYFGLATTAIASITGLSLAFRGASEQAAKMDDTYSDVMKTTGLTREEVVWLNDEFKKFSTRTSREELNKLARDAGKLGIEGRDNILSFVKAANKINVALREDLGEDAVLNIGKIAEIFKLTKEMGIESAYAAIGSAINSIGQSSSAQEQFLVDFTKRIAGAGYQAGLSLQNILGYASALDQSGAQVEMSATAFQNFLLKMYSETDTMAKIANMDVKTFAKLLSTDVNSAIIAVLTGLNSKGGLSQMVPLFKEMGGEGARFVSVLSALGTNINLVTDAQKLSNVEFDKATSLEKEYAIKNNNRQAMLEKARKAFLDQVIILGEKLSPAFLQSTNASTLFLKAIMAIDKEFIYAAIVFAAAILLYKSWNLVIAAGNTIMTAAKITYLAFTATIELMRGNTIRAAAAWKLLNTTMSASAIGAIVTAVAALGYGLYKLITYQSDLTKATKEFYKEQAKATFESNALFDAISKTTKGSEEYKALLKKITDQYTPYLQGMIDEEGNLINITAARQQVNQELIKTIALKVQEQAIGDIINKSLEKQADTYENLVQHIQAVGNTSEIVARIQADSMISMIKSGEDIYEIHRKRVESGLPAIGTNWLQRFKEQNDKMVRDVKAIQNKFSFLEATEEVLGPSKPEKLKSTLKEVSNIIETDAEKEAKAKEERFKKELEAIDKKEKEKQIVLKKQLLDEQLTKDGYEALMLQNTIDYLSQRNLLYIKYGKDNSTTEEQYLDQLIKQEEKAYDAVRDLLKKKSDAIAKSEKEKAKKAESETLNNQIKSTKITPLADDYKATETRLNRIHDLEKQAEEIHEKFSVNSWKKRKALEKKNLDDMLSKGLISQNEYESSVRDMKLKYAVEVAQAVNSIVQIAADFYNSVKEAEFARLETQKQKELALAGDNTDARSAIEAKYEKKKLQLQVKYADKDMAVKIAQSIAAGALAIVQAYAQLGPIAGSIAAVFIAGTTAVQISSIVQQRNALKASLQSSENSTGTTKTVSGYSRGGFTDPDDSDMKPVGIVHANEWVAPAIMVRSNPVLFAQLERERDRINRYHISSPVKQFASGGFTSPEKSDNNMLTSLIMQLIFEIRGLKEKPWKGYVVLSELNAASELESRIKNQGSL